MSIKDDLIKNAVAMLKKLKDENVESAHGNADEILLDLLETLGYEEVVEAYNELSDEVGFYYA